ncbi:unnamed protein product, partial [Discosporangium mesarthrocarpum]
REGEVVGVNGSDGTAQMGWTVSSQEGGGWGGTDGATIRPGPSTNQTPGTASEAGGPSPNMGGGEAGQGEAGSMVPAAPPRREWTRLELRGTGIGCGGHRGG